MKAVAGWLLSATLLAGCAVMVDRAALDFAEDLESAVRGYPDPETVATALPALIMLLEARLQARPNDTRLRLLAARITSVHATVFADVLPEASVQRLTARALEHARIGACQSDDLLCDLQAVGDDEFGQRLRAAEDAHVEPLYVLASSWVSWMAIRADDIDALADLPRVMALLEWVAERDPGRDDGAVWLFLGILHAQRPPAAGGRPDLAREHFARARAASAGHNLLIDVLKAEHYAGPARERERYRELLESVVDSDVDVAEYRLLNQVARDRARRMLGRLDSRSGPGR